MTPTSSPQRASTRVPAELYRVAADLAPEADELTFWAGLGVAAEDVDAGVGLVARAIAVKPAWLILLQRLSDDLAPTAQAVRVALNSTAADEWTLASG